MSEGFLITYPCFMLINKRCLSKNADGGYRLTGIREWVTMADSQGERSIAVFTDEAEASQFHEISEITIEVGVVRSENKNWLAIFLEEVESDGKTKNVIFDPQRSDGIQGRTWPLDYAIRQIKSGLDLR